MNPLFTSNIKRKLIKLSKPSIKLGNVTFSLEGSKSLATNGPILIYDLPLKEWQRESVILDAQKLFADEAICEIKPPSPLV